jgi:hypothetical protein
MESATTAIEVLRREYHRTLQEQIWGYDGPNGRPSNADTGSAISITLARGMLEGVVSATTSPSKGQAAGARFAQITKTFIENSFSKLAHIRPGTWHYSNTPGKLGITAFEQYAHLATLQRILETNQQNSEFRTAFASDYLVSPDIVVGRFPINDDEINANEQLIDTGLSVANHTPLRGANTDNQVILHASISCKWTIRSDRAQNTRTEALNLIRNRKGNTPHIVVVTGEPMPTRLASLALGTGDLDCVYHMALNELQRSLRAMGDESQQEMFDLLVEGRRLRDISDLPFDLAI